MKNIIQEKRKLNIKRQIFSLKTSNKGNIPVVNVVVQHLGIAKNGPIVK